MKIFISWSGERSHQVATALRSWLPCVINDLEPWVSQEDIAKGTHWPTHLSRELNDSHYGIICITPENMDQPWILFEAGALSKAIEDSRVSPFLFGIDKRDLKPPLGHFQSTNPDKEDTKKLLESINSAVETAKGKSLSQEVLTKSFSRWWPDLEKDLAEIPKAASKQAKRAPDEVLDEIVETVRGLSRELAQVRNFQIQQHDNLGTYGPFLVPGNQDFPPNIVTVTSSRAPNLRDMLTQIAKEESTLKEKRKNKTRIRRL